MPAKSLLRFLHPVTDAPLLAPAAFSALYERTHLSVFRYAYGLTGGPQQDVEDLTAEAFIRAWKARRTFHGDDGAALGWLFKIARRLVIDDYRRRKVREAVPAPELILSTAEGLAPQPEDSALVDEAQHTLLVLLRNLPDEPREMLTLRYLLGWRVNQIAEYLEIPENTISVTIRRALERLRQEWPVSSEGEKI